LRILEVGTYEGRASIFFLNFFPRSTFVGIDWFEGELGAPAAARLDHNMAPYGDRVEVLKMDAVAALEQLASAQRKFDLIYIDVSHYYDIAKAATRAAWSLTVPGSVVIWDDYVWGHDLPPEQRGATAIDEFLRERDGSYRVLGRGYQLAVERRR
jgi:predicted O-methyltransferase YrrM